MTVFLPCLWKIHFLCVVSVCVKDILFLHISEGELIVRLLMELTLDSRLSNISVIYPLLKNRYFL